MVREQILSSCSSALVAFLKESKPTSADSIIVMAERFREAHPRQNMAAAGSVDLLLVNVAVPGGVYPIN